MRCNDGVITITKPNNITTDGCNEVWFEDAEGIKFRMMLPTLYRIFKVVDDDIREGGDTWEDFDCI